MNNWNGSNASKGNSSKQASLAAFREAQKRTAEAERKAKERVANSKFNKGRGFN